MSSRTTNVDLFKWDTTSATDLDSQFDLDKAINENWDKIDTAIGEDRGNIATKANSTDVYTKTATNTLLNAKANTSDVTTALANKVDKEAGKSLSTNDYTTAEKTKLSGIETNAEVNIIEDVKVDGTSLTITNKAVNITGKENTANKVTSIDDESTDTQYPSAKCVYDSQEEQNDEIAELKDHITDLENNQLTGTASGETIDISDSANMRFKQFDISGKTEQAQYSGKNLLPYNNVNFASDNTTWFFLDGAVGASGTNIGSKTNIKSQVENGSSYTFSYNILKAPGTFQLVYEDEQGIGTMPSGTGNHSYTFISDRDGYIVPRLRVTSGTDVEITKIQLEKGTTATDYEPYTGGQASPNPDYPQEIHNVTGKNEIVIDNGNLFINGNIENYRTYDVSNGSVSADPNSFIQTSYISVKPDTLYVSNKGSWFRFIEYNANKQFIRGYLNKKEITTTSNTKFIRVCGLISDLNTLRITEGNYQSQTYTIPLQQPMRKIGNYADTFVKENGVWYERHVIGEYVFTGNEGFVKHSSSANNVFLSEINAKMPNTPISNNNVAEMKCNYFGIDAVNTLVFNNKIGTAIPVGSIFRIYICTGLNGISTVSDLKTWLAEKYANGIPVYVDYELQTPTDLPCTQAQTAVLEEISKTAKSYKGTTHIYSISDGLNPIIDVEYVKDINILNTKINELDARVALLE